MPRQARGSAATGASTTLLFGLLLPLLVLAIVACEGSTGHTPTSATAVAHTATSAEPSTITTVSPQPLLTGKEVVLRIEIKNQRSSFLEVRQDNGDGKILLYGTFKSGERLTCSGSTSYWLQVGTPPAVMVFIDDKQVPIDGQGGLFVVGGAGIERTQ